MVAWVIRAMLLNARYRGLYVHGKIKKVRKGAGAQRVRADASEVMTIEIPEWRIIDDETWTRAQERFAPDSATRKMTKPRARYALTGVARCGVCDGAVGCASTRTAGDYRKFYACVRHHQRGPRACAVSVRQRMEDIENALISYLERHLLSVEVIDQYAREIRAAIEAQIPSREADAAALEQELRDVKAEQRRLTKAVALADDVPELVTELRERATRARNLEVRIATIRRAPGELQGIVERAEVKVRERLGDARTALMGRSDLRAVFLRLSRRGFDFTRAAWEHAGLGNRGSAAPKMTKRPGGRLSVG